MHATPSFVWKKWPNYIITGSPTSQKVEPTWITSTEFLPQVAPLLALTSKSNTTKRGTSNNAPKVPLLEIFK